MLLNNKLIEDFNYIYFSPKIDNSIYPKRSLLNNLIFFFAKLGRDFIFDLWNFRFFFSVKNKLLFYSTSANDAAPLVGIFEKFQGDKIIINNPGRPEALGTSFPKFAPTLISFFLLPWYLLFYFKLSTDKKEKVSYSRNDLLMTFGYFYYFRYLLKRSRPTGLVIAHDHGIDTRILVYWCNVYNIPSFYVQHASVTENFPKLDMTFALLEGEDAKQKYLLAGSDSSKIHLIGMIKFDPYFGNINKSIKINTIGYAISLEDPKKLIEDLNLLKTKFPDFRIVLRPHPWFYTYMQREKLSFLLGSLELNDKFLISDPRKQSAFEFLSQIDFLISGDSSIHLEATLLNVLPVYYDNTGKSNDSYGYARNGLVFHTIDFQEVIKFIAQYKDERIFVRDKAKPYVATLNSLNDGRSALLAVEIIEKNLHPTA
ncbi:MAG TPA: hypothetical protein VFU05_18835 [Cyclobacteriaceae bacterium]|nr:hypothetical protein [Cyclobacteriaceae bacterium]